ncbi:MAG: energy transducer TonB [Chryseobacterium sp.]|nr:MAG: energy transducer TonB [Chryseobacterium sp.]
MATENLNAAYDEGRTLDEIVFEHRNKEYGAYDLRQAYRPLLTRSFLIGTVLFIILVAGPFLYLKMKAGEQVDQKIVSVDLTQINEEELPPPPQEEEAPPPPPPPPVEPPQQEVIRDVIPEPKPNPKVEEPPRKIEEVRETTIGTKSQEGEKVATYTPPPPPPSTGTGAKTVEAPKPIGNEIVERVDQDAEFIGGGLNKFRNLVAQNFDTGIMEGEGTVKTTITFVVERDGSISDVKASGPNSTFNREAERTIRSIRGKWKPGKVNGQEVRSRFRLPLTMNFE